MSLYEEAGKDSAILKEKIKNDPYYLPGRQDPELPEGKIMDQLEKLKSVIHQNGPPPETYSETVIHPKPNTDLLEKLMSNLNSSPTHDPRMDQLSVMLDKVMAIQHPQILQDSLDRMAAENKEAAYSVKLNESSAEPTSLRPIRVQTIF